MTDSWGTVLLLAMVALAIWAAIRRRAQAKRLLEESFSALEFDTPEGRVSGERVTVVSKRQKYMSAMWEGRQVGAQPSDAFWYCVGPGPSYFLVVPSLTNRWGGLDLKWIVRPLTEERMRAALQGDRAGMQRAFGAS
ncbi:hypothetical protein [Pseudoxanthomonas beigongshangi]|jgi:hypothetical protein|uniref:hypothetical protein n=1 Tax=Pseudoxanthomonas beigongshangi TaxID=2782537 RepID=UPI00193BD669|nr:hypothetical protein [Pseudoxanthomonas beigongshangi]UBB25722.1 hypothetical protein LAG73_01125 [Pseudoxanthomonas japonensis]